MFSNYKKSAEINKAKIIKQNVKSFKKKCMSDFKASIKRGIGIILVSGTSLPYEFEEEIMNSAMNDLKIKYQDIAFSFVYNGCNNSYLNIKMEAL